MCKRVLFIGGNGNISWYCVQKALAMGCRVCVLNRGATALTRPAIQREAKWLRCDIRNLEKVRQMLAQEHFDVVCDFICMNDEQARERVALFRGQVQQYFFISSDCVYSRRKNALPFKETAEQYDLSEVHGYIAGKIRAEQVFIQAFEREDFPIVIVRPYMVYSTLLLTPIGGGDFTQAKLILEGKPLLMPGDGNNLVAPMHAEDFANAFIPMIGNLSIIGEAFHIANTHPVTWNTCMEQFLEALSPKNEGIQHIPSSDLDKWDIFAHNELLRQQMGDNVFDCAKIKALVPGWKPLISYRDGIARTLRWLHEDPRRMRIDAGYEEKMRELYKAYCSEI